MNSWMNDPSLSEIAPEKLSLLQLLADQGSSKSPQELLPFLMAFSKSEQTSDLHFTEQETELILHALKADKSPEQIRKLDRLIKLMRFM